MWKFIGRQPQVLKSNYTFKMQHSFSSRERESQRLKERYPDKIPIIVEKSEHSFLPELKQSKYLFPDNKTVGDFMRHLRTSIELDSSQAMFLFVNNTHIPSMNEIFKNVYAKHSDKDGFLYITYTSENTFG